MFARGVVETTDATKREKPWNEACDALRTSVAFRDPAQAIQMTLSSVLQEEASGAESRYRKPKLAELGLQGWTAFSTT